MLPYITVLVFAIIDHFFTCWEIGQGIAKEANPLMVRIMTLPANLSLLIRILWIAALLLLLWYLSRYKPVLVRRSILLVVSVYSLVVVYHLALLTLCFNVPLYK
ncbi:MAG: DUF5658 family protein [Desulfotomaculaceae bacterium]|nr:DUF5658 family protein [Desulfotomaculaceae bacterium]